MPNISPRRILDAAAELFKGEPARAIGYGGAAIIYFVARLSGTIEDISIEQSVLTAAGFIATAAGFVESIRRLVYSPATVEVLVENAATTGDATFPPPPADEVKPVEDAPEGDTT